MIAVLAGAVAGIVHVLAGPDHLASMAPLSIEHGRKSWRIGLRWGLGHSVGVTIIGLLLVLLHDLLPLEAISSWSEYLVGVILIGIGVWGIRKALVVGQATHSHPHEHVYEEDERDQGPEHAHVHLHMPENGDAEDAAFHQHSHAALGIGFLHGLAGGTHFIGLLPALVLPNHVQRFTYVAAYALGTIVAMASFSSVVGWISERLTLTGGNAYRGLMLTCSGTAVLVGIYWLTGPLST